MKKTVALLMALILALGMVPFAALADDTVTVPYVNEKGAQQDPATCTQLTGSNGTELRNGWYAVTENIIFSSTLTTYGDVNLVLCDNKTLTAKGGVYITNGSTLTIWAQSTGSSQGAIESKPENGPGIGGTSGIMAGNLIINGGRIVANGGNKSAGIGGGEGDNSGYQSITINGGSVTATGGNYAAGIGGGQYSYNNGKITITGGTVNAHGGKCGAGIGGGEDRSGPEIRISGGTVTTIGGQYGAGIGGGQDGDGGNTIISGGNVTAHSGREGAGIGGGKGREGNEHGGGGIIEIRGGTVTARGDYGAGIGSAVHGSSNTTIRISGGIVTATGINSGAGIGGGWSSDASTVIISGGEVTATGLTTSIHDFGPGAGIGGSCGRGGGSITISGGKVVATSTDYYDAEYGAGIGGGYYGDGGTITITGGTVEAHTGKNSHAIGCGGDQDNSRQIVTIAGDLCVYAGNDGTNYENNGIPFTSNLRAEACKHRLNCLIKACEHPLPDGDMSFEKITDKVHKRSDCVYCGHSFPEEAHSFGKSPTCTVCGYGSSSEVCKVSFDSSGAEGTMNPIYVRRGSTVILPDNDFTVPEGKTFGGWIRTEVDTSTYQTISKVYPAGKGIEVNDNLTVYAKWLNLVTITATNQEATYSADGIAIPPENMFTIPENAGRATYSVAKGTGTGTYDAQTNNLKVDKCGTFTVTVSTEETDTYAAATTSAVLTVNPAPVTIAAKDQNIYVDDPVPDLVGSDFYTVTGLSGEDTLTTEPTLTYQKNGAEVVPDNTASGTYDIVPSGASAGDNYDITYVNGQLTIKDKFLQTITAEDVFATYGDTDKSVSAATDGDGTISYAVKEGSEDFIEVDAATGALKIKKAGTAIVVVTAAGTSTYAEATREVTVEIAPKSIAGATVSLDKTQLTYNGNEQTVNVTGVTIDGMSLTENDYDVTGNKGTKRRTYTVTVTGKGNFRDSATAQWSIAEKAMTVSVTGYTGVYDGQPHGITVTVTEPASGATVKYGKTAGIYDLNESPTITDAGTMTVYFRVRAKDYPDYTGYATVVIMEKPAEVFTVTFCDGIGNTLKTETVESGGSATAPADPARDGYTFDGWDTDFSNVRSNLTVTAKWKQIIVTHKVTFEDGLGNVLAEQDIVDGRPAAAPEDPTRDGFVFSGWDTDFSSVRGDLTVKALWTEATQEEDKFTVVFVLRFGFDPVSQVVEKGGSATAPDVPEVDGFTFTGWDKEFTDVTDNLTVTAQWKKKTAENMHTVVFVDGYSYNPLLIQRVKDGQPATPPEDPTREGYTFEGWDTDFSYVTTDLTVIAQWKQNTLSGDPAKVTTAPTARNLTYNGSAQELVTAGTAEGGAILYALGADAATAPTEGWSATVPAATEAGTYYVWYKAGGDDEHSDSEAVCITVTIKEPAPPAPPAEPVTEPETQPVTEPVTQPVAEPVEREKPSGDLNALLKTNGLKALTLSWTPMTNVDGYDVFMAGSTKKFGEEPYATLTPEASQMEFGNLKKKTAYKVNIRAFVLKDGVKEYVGQNETLYSITGGANQKFTNAAKISAKDMSLAVGDKKQAKVTVKGQKKGKAILSHGGAVRYLSSDPTIATVSEKGFVRGVGEGSCTIFLSTHNGLRTTITVTVTGGPEELKFDKKSYKLSVGKTLKLKKELTMLPEGTKAEVKWKSSDKKIATVDENGKVTAKKAGTVKITVTTSNGITATVKIKIK